ncbi:hypothetical protein OPT61_g7566 [Boeremia exigua]|uniref:Uncharacterized protein n=1 Tax=Boeremia exigua TaxID=749465 RepID=A0ACC2I1R4_9PLEO|nr:hypothetical protein OPT61_g7566 [Boeremia exigua]
MVTANPQPALWQQAFDALSSDHKISLSNSSNQHHASTSDLLKDALSIVKANQKSCMDKRWKIKRNGKEVFIRDIWEKAAKWIQKFKDVGDIAVQFDTSAASLPWAAVRLILQVSINDVEIFGAVAEGVELISRTIARCALYEAVYLEQSSVLPESKDFQEELVQLYTAVLCYLSMLSSYYKRGTASRILGSLGNSTGHTREQREEVEKLENNVERFSHLLHAKATAQMAVVLQSIHKDRGTRFQKLEMMMQSFEQPMTEIAHTVTILQTRMDDSERQALLTWLSPANHLDAHARAYHDVTPGTGAWFLNSTEYQSWSHSSSSTLLWVRGIAGCGKTKLMSLTIQELLRASVADQSRPPIAYFYCSKNNVGTLGRTAKDVIRDLLKQLTCRSLTGKVHDLVDEEYHRSKADAARHGVDLLAPSMETCLSLLSTILNEQPALIVIDGIDELEDPSKLLLELKDLVARSLSATKVLIASRDQPSIRPHIESYPGLTISSAHNAEDIEAFINTSLDRAIQEKRLLGGEVSVELRRFMTEALVSRASSMFLWASLFIKQFCDNNRYHVEEDIRRDLRKLPAELPSLLQQIYGRIEEYPSVAKQLTKNIISWLLVAQRPLTISELAFFSEGGTSLMNNRSPMTQKILDLCSGLVVPDLDSSHLNFAHTSVREFLEGLPEFSVSRLNVLATRTCLEYLLENARFLNDSDSDSDSGSDRGNIPTLHTYSTLFWARHYASIDSTDVEEPLDRLLATFVLQSRGQQLRYWVEDVHTLLKNGTVSDPILFGELSAIICDESNPAIFVIAVYGLSDLLNKLAAARSTSDWDIKNSFGASPLYVSARYGHTAIVEGLLKLGASLNIGGGHLGSPLQAAAYSGHDDTVRRLIACGADPWQKAKFDSAVHSAIAGGRQSTAITILAECAGHEKARPAMWLTIAAYNGLRGLVETLLEQVDKEEPGTVESSLDSVHDVLQGYLYRGLEKAAMTELQKLPNINAQGGHFGNALQAACMGGNRGLVKRLLKKGADPNTTGTYGSPIQAASLSGKLSTVKLLLDSGATAGRTGALTAASSQGHIAIVNLLVQQCDIEAYSDSAYSWSGTLGIGEALCAASRHGHCEVVELLLQHGAESCASRALESALENHQHAVARILFSHITTLQDYTRFPVVMCSVPGEDEWLHLDVDKELGVTKKHYRQSVPLADVVDTGNILGLPASTDFGGDCSGNMLGADQPQGMKYLQSLFAVRASAEGFASALDRGLKLNPPQYPAPIELAAKVGNLEVVGLLLDRGAELRSALQTAVYCQQPEVVHLILQKRPNTEVDVATIKEPRYSSKGIRRQSALSVAIKYRRMDLFVLLLETKARSGHPGPGPSLCAALSSHDPGLINSVLQSTCRIRESNWTSHEQSFVHAALELVISELDVTNLQKVIEMTGILTQARHETLAVICRKLAQVSYCDSAAKEDYYRMFEYVVESMSSEEVEELSGEIFFAGLKAERERSRRGNRWIKEEKVEKGLQQHEALLKFLSPYTGSASFKSGVTKAFEFLLGMRDYEDAKHLLVKHSRPFEGSIQSSFLLAVIDQMVCPDRYRAWDNQNGLVELIRYVLDQGANMNQKNAKGQSLLAAACSKGWVDVVFLLLEAGADVNATHEFEFQEEDLTTSSEECQSKNPSSSKDSAAEDPSVQGPTQQTAPPRDVTPSQVEKPLIVPKLSHLNLLELTLKHAEFGLDGNPSKKQHVSWANIIFKLIGAGLNCQYDNPGLKLMFESACYFGLLDHVRKCLDPATWSAFRHPPPASHFVESSAGIQIAAYRGERDVVKFLIAQGADSTAKPWTVADHWEVIKGPVTPLQAALETRSNKLDEDTGYPDLLDTLIDLGGSKGDMSACLRFFLSRDQLERAERLLQQGVEVPFIPGDLSCQGLQLLCNERYIPLVAFESLTNDLPRSLENHNLTYSQLEHRIATLHALGVSFPAASTLLYAAICTRFSVSERVKLLDSLMLHCNHDINSVFPCKGCKQPVSLLSLAISHSYLSGFEELLYALLEHNANIDAPGLPISLFVLVCRHSDYEDDEDMETRCSMAKILLQHGANVHGDRTTRSDTEDKTIDETPLMFAVAANNIELATLLIQHGADVNRGSVAPLNIALHNKRLMTTEQENSLIDLLIRSGAETRRHDRGVEAHLDVAMGYGEGRREYTRFVCDDCEIYLEK